MVFKQPQLQHTKGCYRDNVTAKEENTSEFIRTARPFRHALLAVCIQMDWHVNVDVKAAPTNVTTRLLTDSLVSKSVRTRMLVIDPSQVVSWMPN